MSRFNTGNPLGSGDPRDLDDNAKNMDLAVNSDGDTFQDRMGRSRLTWAGIVKAGSGDPAIAVDAAARAEAAASQVEQNAEQIAQEAAQQAVAEVAGAVDGAVDRAVDAADRAETEADRAEDAAAAAAAAGSVFDTTAQGLAATVDGQYFLLRTEDPQVFDVYLNDGGVAVASGQMEIAASALTGLELNTHISDFMHSGRFFDGEVAAPLSMLNDQPPGNFDWGVENGELVISGSGPSWNGTRYWDIGRRFYGVEPMVAEIDITIGHDLGSLIGAQILLGSNPDDRVAFTYFSNGGIGVYNATIPIVEKGGGFVVTHMAFTPGGRVQLRVVIYPDGSGMMTATSPTGEKYRHPIHNVTARGVVAPAMRRQPAGYGATIHSFSCTNFVPKNLTETELLRHQFPNLVPGGDSSIEGWVDQTGTISAQVDADGVPFLQVDGGASITTIPLPEQRPEAATIRLRLLESFVPEDGLMNTIRILQYTDRNGTGHNAEMELRGTRLNINPPSQEIIGDDGYLYAINVLLAPETERIGVQVQAPNADGKVTFREFMIALGTDPDYRAPLVSSAGSAWQEQVDGTLNALDIRVSALESSGPSPAAENEPVARVPYPSDLFTFREHGVTIYQGLRTKSFYTDFNPISKIIAAPNNFYVDPASGSDSNNGSEASPFATVTAAVTAMNVSGTPATIFLASGRYLQQDVGILPVVTQDFNLICTGDTPAVLIQGAPSAAWVPHATETGVWQASVPGALWAFDEANPDEYGEGTPLFVQPSVVDVSSAGGMHVADGVIYVRLVDDRQPDSSLIVLLDRTGWNMGTQAWYWRNIQMLGASNSVVGTTNRTDAHSCFDQCRLSYSYSDNALSTRRNRGGTVYVYRSVASWSRTLDGWNYHRSGAGNCHDVIEIDSIGHHNGLNARGNNNGTTMHDGGRIIRVNGRYTHNMDRNVHDINNQTEAWLLGCEAGLSQNDRPLPYDNACYLFGRRGQPDETLAWIDSCISYGAQGDYGVYGNSVLHVRNTDVSEGNFKVVDIEGGGQLVPY